MMLWAKQLARDIAQARVARDVAKLQKLGAEMNSEEKRALVRAILRKPGVLIHETC